MGNGNTGLKNQFGVGDPKTPGAQNTPNAPNTPDTGSDKQAQDFQAAFQQEQGVINGHLQYTAVNAEASRHDPLAARRDALFPSFQAALGKIDRKDPSKAQGDIDKVLGEVRALSGEVATFRQDAEKAKTDWDSRQGKYDDAVRQVEELEAWEDPKAPALRGLVDGIRTHVNQRQYAQAVTTLDQLLPKLAPIYEEYLRQKEAKPQYEQQRAEQSARLDPLKAADRPSQPMTAKAGEADAALREAKGKADAKDFVAGLEGMAKAKALVDELDTLTNDPQRQQYLADSQAAEQTCEPQPEPAFKTLEADWSAISGAGSQAQPLADSGDYAGANQALADAKAKRAEFQRKYDELVQKKQEYETALAALQPRLQPVSVSDPAYAKIEPQLQEITQAQTAMEASAQASDYDQANTQLQDLSTKLDAYEQAKAGIDQEKQEYEAALAAMQPQLAEAAKPPYKSLEAKHAEITTAKAAMEAAAQAGDFMGATQMATNLQAKLAAYLAEHEKLAKAETDCKAAWTPLQAKLSEALLSSRAFAALSAERTAIASGQSAVEAAMASGDFEGAAKLIPDLETKVAAYLTAAKAKDDEVKKKGDEIGKQLDGASDATRADVAKSAAAALTEEQVKALPTDVRNRLLTEMQKGGIDEGDKAAMKNLFSQKYLDPKFEKLDDATRQKLIDKMKQDPDFKKARDNWATISEAERVAVLKKAADYQAEAYGIGKTEVEAYSPKNADGTLRRQRMGEYSDADGKLKISREAMQDKGFDKVMDTVMHENGHRYQTELLKKLDATPPGLKPGDPEYDQAMTFKLNDKYYIQPKVNSTDAPTPDTGDEYFTQPMESHSRRTGEGVAAAGIGK